jgi:hypothetical protein
MLIISLAKISETSPGKSSHKKIQDPKSMSCADAKQSITCTAKIPQAKSLTKFDTNKTY